MKIIRAQREADWVDASAILVRVANFLADKGEPLWPAELLDARHLKESYRFEELHFIVAGTQRIGVVFLQEADPLFWPEMTDSDSLYIHKLALDPRFMGQRHGARALHAILHETRRRQRDWLRLDCDDRAVLHGFYQGAGFEMVDFTQVGALRVARYQLPVLVTVSH